MTQPYDPSGFSKTVTPGQPAPGQPPPPPYDPTGFSNIQPGHGTSGTPIDPNTGVYQQTTIGGYPYQSPAYQPPAQTPPPTAQTPGLPTIYSGPSPTISGVNLGDPGQGEQFWNQNQGRFTAPTASQGLLGSAAGQFGLGGNGTTNNQQGFFGQFNQQLPGVMQTPGLDPYYDRAIQKGENDINKTMAARGLYGSSAAGDQIENLVGGMRADQAQHEAQYNLQKLGEERGWQGLGGSLAQGADVQSLGQSANERNWLGQFGNLAGQADTTGLGLLNSGVNASLGAQGAGINRFNTAMGAEMGIDQATAAQMADAYKGMFGNDQGLFNNWVQLGLGPAAQNLNMNQYLAGQNSADLSGLLSGLGSAASKIPGVGGNP